MSNALELLKSAATVRVTGNDPVKTFVNRINTQLAYAKDIKDGKTVNSKSTWFKRNGTGYLVSIGRSPLAIAGTEWFAADDIDGVIAVLAAGREVIQTDKQVQAAVIERAAVKGAKLAAARKAKAKK